MLSFAASSDDHASRYPTAGKAATAVLLTVGRHFRGLPEPGR